MNKSLLKNFATQARVRLMKDVAYRLGLMGITKQGNAQPSARQPGMEAYEYARGEQFKLFGTDIEARRHLAEEARAKGFDQLVEEVAYTWFNRLIAIRFMEVNDYLPTHTRVLSSVTPGQSVPDIVTHALDIDLGLTGKEKEQVLEWKLGSKVDPLFRFLFLKQCDQLSKVLPGLFVGYRPASSYSPYDNPSAGSMGFTEDPYKLLLTLSCIDPDGLVARLLEIPEDYFNVSARDEEGQPTGQVEIIGWMYQFYNMELKDDTFEQLKKNVKIPKERIPAATQLFTPHWIVRYMVENSLGRLWVEKLLARGDRRSEADIAKAFGWDYYLPEAEQLPEVQTILTEQRKDRASLRPEDIRLLDPCMGSGHILVYAFDVLMQLYLSSGYTQRDSAKLIVEKNLWGIDIDERAWQLSHFAILMKARQYNRQALNAISFTHLYPVRDTRGWSGQLLDYIAGGDRAMRDNLDILKAAYADAETLGSIICPPAVETDKLYEHWRGDILGHYHPDIEGRILQQQTETHFLPVLLQHRALEQKYHVVVTNPPYMGSSGMNNLLSSYVKEEYPDSKSDLFAVFIERCGQLLRRDGYQAMITQHAWMFLSSYEKLRAKLLKKEIINMAHLGARAFEEIGGEVVQTTTFVFGNNTVTGYLGTYLRLVAPNTQAAKQESMLSGESQYIANQSDFIRIPGKRIVYWYSKPTVWRNALLDKYNFSGGRNKTHNNDKYVREWWELQELSDWILYMNGGIYRKWFGNLTEVVNWSDAAKTEYSSHGGLVEEEYVARLGVSWNGVSGDNLGFRLKPRRVAFSSSSPTIISTNNEYPQYEICLLNTQVGKFLLNALNPTLQLNVGEVLQMPCVIPSNTNAIINYGSENIAMVKSDWDSFEYSWEFKRHPMLD